MTTPSTSGTCWKEPEYRSCSAMRIALVQCACLPTAQPSARHPGTTHWGWGLWPITVSQGHSPGKHQDFITDNRLSIWHCHHSQEHSLIDILPHVHHSLLFSGVGLKYHWRWSQYTRYIHGWKYGHGHHSGRNECSFDLGTCLISGSETGT